MSPVANRIAQLGQMLREELEKGAEYLPAGPDIFRAFTYPFDQVKVLLIGQDPYPTPGNPIGLSFSVQPGVKPPASLRNIFQELHSDLGLPQPSSGDLRPWSERGVMLLNRVLTVEPGKPQSHRKRGWEEVTDCAVRALAQRDQPLVAILWGADAQSVKPLLGDVPTVESVHPSPLSAYRGFFGSQPFSRTNILLQQMGAKPIDWQLP